MRKGPLIPWGRRPRSPVPLTPRRCHGQPSHPKPGKTQLAPAPPTGRSQALPTRGGGRGCAVIGPLCSGRDFLLAVAPSTRAPVVRAGTSLAKSRVSKSVPAASSHVGAAAPSLLDPRAQPALAGCEAARRRLDHWSPPPSHPSSGRARHAPVG